MADTRSIDNPQQQVAEVRAQSAARPERISVFVSVGRTVSDEQKAFLAHLDVKLQSNDLVAKTIGRNTFTSGQPLLRIQQTMEECSGMLVVAFERTRIRGGVELQLDEDSIVFRERSYATPWHHAELGMATMLGLPTLVVLQKGVFEEGLLEDKHGWYVIRTKLATASLDSSEFTGILNDWILRAREYKAAATDLADAAAVEAAASTARAFAGTDVGQATVGQLVKQMRPGQVWGVLVAAATVVGGAFVAGTWIDKFRTPTKTERIETVPAPNSNGAIAWRSRFVRGNDIPALGGHGGTEFGFDCVNSLARGIEAQFRNGYVVALRMLCGKPRTGTGEPHLTIYDTDATQAAGTLQGAEWQRIVCPSNSLVRDIGVFADVPMNFEDAIVRGIAMRCATARPPLPDGRVLPSLDEQVFTLGEIGPSRLSQCEASWVSGVFGRAGTLVDSMGARCSSLSMTENNERQP